MSKPNAAERAMLRAVLGRKLAALADAGTPPPCTGSDLWTSDDPAELDDAAAGCDDCPALVECRAVGQGEAWGVWGGRVVGGRRPVLKEGSGRWAALVALATAPGPLTREQLAADAAQIGPVPTSEASRVSNLAREGLVAVAGNLVRLTAIGAQALGDGASES